MKYLLGLIPLLFIGCGEDTQTVYYIDGNGSIPYDSNTTIVSTSNITNFTFGDNAIYVVSENNSTGEVVTGTIDNSSDSSIIDNSVESNGSI